ncbi:MAG: hypothetical protein ACXVFN_08030 [Solirubrobacteraceae bacterium]
MAVTTHVLVVANRTVDAPALHAALMERARRGPIHVTLLAPVPWSQREEARGRLDRSIRALNQDGVSAGGVLGDADPIVAVQETWDPGTHDEIIVATLAEGSSRWLEVGLPQRIARLTDCPVTHIEVREPRPHAVTPRPEPERRPLVDTVLSFLQTSPRSRRAS